MERSLGLRECPRCGLKNRGSSHQCDFCGYDFQSTDTWMDDVKELEQINEIEKAESIDSDTVTKIESTFIKKEGAEKKSDTGPVKKREPVVIVRSRQKVESHEKKASTAEPTPPLVAESSETVSMATSEASVKVTPISSKGMKVFTTHVPTDVEETVSAASYLPPTYLVSIGSFVYIGTLLVAATSHISRLIGWAMVILGAILIVAGVGWALRIRKPSLMEEREEEVLLCPLCHEVVSKSDHECPNCHAGFEDVGIEEGA